jgi:beta-fructofuranosidase
LALRFDDHWIWDFWIVRKESDYHVFYLQAPRSAQGEDSRHWSVTIGHAVSNDLTRWRVLPNALAPGPPGSWDDYTTWTGSIVEHEGVWNMFYTGGKRSEEGLIQRIGLATSSDLVHWHKHPDNPVMVSDPRWYEQLNLENWHDQAWRDPWIYQDPDTQRWHALITARSNLGPADERGVIGHARSDNLVDWDVLPPFTEPGHFGHLEVPQLVEAQGRYYLLFSVAASEYSRRRTLLPHIQPRTGTHYSILSDPLSFQLAGEADAWRPLSSLYAGKLIQIGTRWCFLGWLERNAQGHFVGEISDPLRVEFSPEGELTLHPM